MSIEEVNVYKDLSFLSQINSNGLNHFFQPDIKDRHTSVELIINPQLCVNITETLINLPDQKTHDNRRIVTYTPVIQLANDGGWDSLPTYNIHTLRRGEKTGEQFSSWGITEKVNLHKLLSLKAKFPNIPDFCILAMIGLIEELDFEPMDIKVAFPKPDIKPPIKASDLEIRTYAFFGIETFPLGIIFNRHRADAPLVLVIPSIIRGNNQASSRDRDLGYLGDICLLNIQEVLNVVEGRNEDPFYANFPNFLPFDSWSTITARGWKYNFNSIQRVRQNSNVVLGKNTFSELQRLITEL